MKTNMLYMCICFFNSLQFPIFLLKWCISKHENLYVIYKEELNKTSVVLTYIPHEVTVNMEFCLMFFVSGVFSTLYLHLKIYNENNYEVLEECSDIDWNNTDELNVWKMTLSKICLYVYMYIFYSLFFYITLCGEWNFTDKIWITELDIKCLALTKIIVLGIWLNTLNPKMKRCFLFLIIAISLSLWYEINLIRVYEIPSKILVYKVFVWILEVLLIFGGQGDTNTTFMTFLHSSLIFISSTSLIIQCIAY